MFDCIYLFIYVRLFRRLCWDLELFFYFNVYAIVVVLLSVSQDMTR